MMNSVLSTGTYVSLDSLERTTSTPTPTGIPDRAELIIRPNADCRFSPAIIAHTIHLGHLFESSHFPWRMFPPDIGISIIHTIVWACLYRNTSNKQLKPETEYRGGGVSFGASNVESYVVTVPVFVDSLRVLSLLTIRHRLLPVTVVTDSHILGHNTDTTPRHKTVVTPSIHCSLRTGRIEISENNAERVACDLPSVVGEGPVFDGQTYSPGCSSNSSRWSVEQKRYLSPL